MLTYNMDVEPASLWLHTTPGPVALAQPYFVTEAGLFYGRRQFNTSRTDKESYLIFYTIAGEGYLTQGDQTLRLLPNSAVIIDCRTAQSYGTAPNAALWHHFWIHCDGPGVAELFRLLNPDGILRTPLVSENIRSHFEDILLLMQQDQIESILDLSLLVHQILTLMTKSAVMQGSGTSTVSIQSRSHRERIERAAEYIRAHYTEDLELQQLLRLTSLSRSHFLKLFKQYIGDSPYHYLTCYRITQAKILLEMTDTPIRAIAEQVGFHDECNFSTRFSKIAGETPKQYRMASILNGQR